MITKNVQTSVGSYWQHRCEGTRKKREWQVTIYGTEKQVLLVFLLFFYFLKLLLHHFPLPFLPANPFTCSILHYFKFVVSSFINCYCTHVWMCMCMCIPKYINIVCTVYTMLLVCNMFSDHLVYLSRRRLFLDSQHSLISPPTHPVLCAGWRLPGLSPVHITMSISFLLR